jgi:phosphopantothenoylcysteine decarboxylase/phosphopantothenate--cysteine ligase
MASLTVRQLDDRLKKLLRLRAARNNRSMEDEIRVILRQAAEGAGTDILEQFEPPARPSRRPAPVAASGDKRILLVIGGGIAAYKSLDLIRRLQDHGAQVRCIPLPPHSTS